MLATGYYLFFNCGYYKTGLTSGGGGGGGGEKFKIQMPILGFKILNDLAPASLGSMIQHSRLVVTRLLHQSSRTSSFFNSMFISLPHLWDEIPSNLHTITNLSSFTSGCKKHFMSFLD